MVQTSLEICTKCTQRELHSERGLGMFGPIVTVRETMRLDERLTIYQRQQNRTNILTNYNSVIA